MKKLLLSDYDFKKISLLITLFVAMSWHASAQINIGSGSVTGKAIPVEPYYGFTYSQSIFLASEIGASGNITGVKYFAAAGTSISNSNDWTVYIAHTTKTSFTGSTDWVASASLTQVHTGIVTLVGGEVTITFSSPFNYNGTDNLIIAVDENASGYDGNSDEFLGSAVSAARSIRYRADATNPDPSSPPTATGTISYIPNIQLLGIAQACATPSSQTATSITATTASLGWTENGSATNWDIEWGPNGFSQTTGTTISGTTTNPHSLTGLTANTAYDFYVRADCGGSGTSAWVGPFSFTTLCSVMSAPFSESFDATSLPSCWSQSATSGGPWVFGNPGIGWNTSGCAAPTEHTGNGGNMAAMDFSTPDAGVILELPVVDVSGLTTPYFTFWYFMCNLGYTSSNQIYVEAWNGSTWTAVGSNTIGTSGWEKQAFNVSSHTYSTSLLHLRLRAEPGTGSVYYGDAGIDDVSIDEAPSCLDPTVQTATSITTTTASLGWTENGSATTWDIEWSTTGFTQGAGTMVTGTTTNPHSLTGLTASTTYDFYVRADCGGSGTSSWAGPFSFTTLCGVMSTPFSESFNGTSLPLCWSQSASSGGPWVFGNPASFSWNSFGCSAPTEHTGNSGNMAAMDFSGTDVGVIIEMPEVDVSSLSTPYLSFWYFMCATGYTPANQLYVEAWNGSSWTVVGSNTTGTSGWEKQGIDLSGHTYSSSLVRVRLRVESGGSGSAFYGDAGIDDVLIDEAPSCINPSALTATSVTSSSANLTWSENGSATTWDIEWSTTGFAQGAGTMVTGTTTNPHSLTGLTVSTTYDFYVRSDCGGSTSTWTGPFSFTTLCAVMTSPYLETFDSFLPSVCWDEATNGTPASGPTGLGSGDWEQSSFPGSGTGGTRVNLYSNIKNDWILSPIFDLSSGGPYEVRVENLVTAYSGTGTSAMGSDDQVQVVISNDGGTTWATIYTWDASNTPGNTASFQNIDLSAYSSATTQFAIWATEGASDDAEDYYFYVGAFQIRDLPACPAPNAQTATSITTTASLGWTENGSATTWDIEWSTTGFSQGAGTMVTGTTTNPHSLSGLTANTTYDFYVRADCGGSTSTWTGPFSFTTLPPAHTLPVTEDFEAGLSNFDNALGNDVDWVSSTSLYHSGTKSAYNGHSNNNENIIHETGILDLSTAFSPRIEFWHIAKTEGGWDKCFVEISTDGGSTYTALPNSAYGGAATDYSSRGYFHEDSYSQWGTGTQTPTNSWWKKETFTLTGFKVANVRLRFRLTSDGSANHDGWYIDDIAIKDLSTDDIVITEYARNTTSGNSYLELFNALDVDIDLSGTKIVCSGANSTVIDLGTDVSGSVVVPAGGFLVLASSASQATFETAWSTTLGINVTYNNTGLGEFANNNTFALKIGGTANTNNGTLINQSTATATSGNRIFQLPLGNWAGNNDVAANRATPGSFLNFTDYNQVKFAFTNGVWKSATGYAHSSPNGSTGDAAAVIVSGSASFIDGAILDKLYIWPTGGTSISSQNVTVNTSIKISHEGSLAITGSGAVTCANEISVEKKGYSSTNDYNAWSTPLATGIDFSSVFTSHNPCDFYVFKASDQSWKLDYTLGSSIDCGNGLVTVTAASIIASPEGNPDGKFDVARGYFIVGNASNSSYNFSVSSSGALNNGTITANIYGSNGAIVSGSNDWNLIGNPYPSALSINGFLTANSSVIANALYLYNPGTGINATGSYTALNSTDLTSIASCQGFYVDASTATNGLVGSVSFNNSMRTNSNNDFRGVLSYFGLYLKVTDTNEVVDQTRLYFDIDCSDDLDSKFDAMKMENTNFNISSVVGNDKLVFNGLSSLTTVTKVIPLHFATNENSIYTFSIDSLIGSFSDKDIFLEDKFTKGFYDLKKHDYSFPSGSKEWADRFFIHIIHKKDNSNSSNGGVTGIDEVTDINVKVFTSKNEVIISSLNENQLISKVELLNLKGQVIKSVQTNSSILRIDASKYATGVYVVRTYLDNDEMVIDKVVIQ